MRKGLLSAVLAVVCLGAEIRIEVTDAQAAAVPGAQVRATCGGVTRSGVTGPDGVFGFDCSGAAGVRIWADGFAVETLRTAESRRVILRPALLHTRVEVVVEDAGSTVEADPGGARTVLDAVDRIVPGAFVTRRGVMGYGIATNGSGGITIRGIGGQPNTGVLVVIDGRPDFQGLMGHPLPDFYSLSDAESVSVTQGPASVLYGSNAMGGVVEIRPRRANERRETRLTASGGSFFTGQHRLAHGGRAGRAFYHSAAGVAHTSGDRPSSAFRNQDLSAAGGYDFSEHWKTSLQGRYGFFHVEDPGPMPAPLKGANARVGRGGFSWNADNSFARTFGYARLYGSWGKHWITDGFRSTDSNMGFRAQQTWLATSQASLEFGGDFNRFGGRARNVVQRLDYGDHRLTDGGVFTRVHWTPGTRVQWDAGLRAHGHSVWGALAAPEAGVRVHFMQGYTLSAAAARGFRNPTIRELYLFPAPNPDLRPESLVHTQLTLQARPASALSASATVFYDDLENSILTLGRLPNLRLANSGGAVQRGVETSVRWRLPRDFELYSAHAYLRSTALTPLAPGHKWTTAADWTGRRWSVNVGATVVGRRYTDLRRVAQLGGYTTVTARANFLLRRGLHVFATGDNLLGKRYEVLPGYLMPGRNGLGGMSVVF